MFLSQLDNGSLGKVDIVIADQSGKILKTLKDEKNQQLWQLNVPANELLPGSYFIKVQIGNWSESKKLIKM